MEFEIVGSSMQTLLVELSDGEAMYTERGGMAWLSNVNMDTSARGGLMKGLGRMVSGESLFMTTYTARRGGRKVAFTPEAPGNVWLQSLPLPNLAAKLNRYISKS
ncbi:MAG: AIM24 family protein [Anaerolineae bacterium]